MNPPEQPEQVGNTGQVQSERRRSKRHRHHSSRGKRVRRFLERCALVLIQSLAVAAAGGAVMMVTQPEEAARDLARIVFVITGALALIGFSIAAWRKGR
jgi:hypothetical protein